jgi:hypothetical protein
LCKDTYLSEKWKVKSEKKKRLPIRSLFFTETIFG